MNGYGRASTKDLDDIELEKSIAKWRWTMMIFNVLAFLLGVASFAVCVWIRFDLDFWEWVVEIDWYTYWNAMYVIWVTMSLVIINSVIGAYAIIQVRRL